MRLICPNCGAQYDVSDDAIPPGGRDVQCSNCQVSWFQTEKPTIPGRDTNQAPAPADDPVTEEAAEADADATETGKPDEAPKLDEPKTEEASDADASEPAPEPVARAPRRPLDDAVASILREEAAVSGSAAAATVASAGPISQPPATEAAKPSKPVTADETRQRIALMTAEEGGTPAGSQAKPATGKATTTADEAHLRTVPSINEINATLRARAQANDTSGLTEAEKVEAVQRKGFRRGFFWVLILLAILILPYIFADQITETLPQTTDIMGRYVTMVDQLRVTLNDFVSGLTAN